MLIDRGLPANYLNMSWLASTASLFLYEPSPFIILLRVSSLIGNYRSSTSGMSILMQFLGLANTKFKISSS